MEKTIENSKYAQRAMELFKEGYNCAQAVVLAFEDKYDLDRKTVAMISSSFGGGLGRLREVCGAVSGMAIVAGLLEGYDDPKDPEAKKNHYATIQKLAEESKLANGSILCRELLGLAPGEHEPTPEARSEGKCPQKSCEELVGLSAAILEQYLEENRICLFH